MPSKAEISASLQTLATPIIFEKLLPPVKFVEVRYASSAEADRLNISGNWVEAASHYKVLAEKSENPGAKAWNYIEVSQILINHGRFGQAKEFLESARGQTAITQDDNEKVYLSGRCEEKLAWVADYEGLFVDSLRHLENSEQFVNSIPGDYKTRREEDLLSTITHFKGRAHLGFALQNSGVTKETNITMALMYFRQDLERFENQRRQGQPAPANEGFQHAWIARCQLELEDFESASTSIDKVGKLFALFSSDNPESGIMGHYYQLKGGLEMYRGNFDKARRYFFRSLITWYKKQENPKGEASALFGIASSLWAERKIHIAAIYAYKAVRRYSFILFRPNI